MITVTMEMPLKPGTRDQFEPDMALALKDTATRPGFRSIRMLRPNRGEDKVMFIEEWDSYEDYKAYLAWRSDGNGIQAVDDCIGGKPIVQIWGHVIASETAG